METEVESLLRRLIREELTTGDAARRLPYARYILEYLLLEASDAVDDSGKIDGDPYWVAQTYDGEYYITYTHWYKRATIYDSGFERIKQITGFVGEQNGIDVLPYSHKLLMNRNGTVQEYDIGKDAFETLFTTDITSGMCVYDPLNRDNILIMGEGGTVLRRYRKDGTLLDEWTGLTATRFGSAYPIRVDYIIGLSLGAATMYDQVKPTPSVLGLLDRMDKMTWLHRRYNFMTWGSELNYAFLTEDFGPPVVVFPCAANNVWITEDNEFLFTYWMYLFKMSKKVLMQLPLLPRMHLKEFTIAPGALDGYRVVLGNRGKARFSMRAAAAVNWWIEQDFPLTPWGFPTVFRRTATPNVTEVYRKDGVSMDSVVIDGSFAPTAIVYNPTAADVAVQLHVATWGE